MKKLIFGGLLLMAMLAFAACGNKEGDSTMNGADTPAVTEPKDTPTPEATATPEATPTPEPTATPEPTPTPEGPTPTIAPDVKVTWDTSNVDISWIDPNAKLIAFTFDDGPTAYYKQLLDVLEENNAHATFFVWGNRYKVNFEDDIKRVIELGCELGNHTWSHGYLTKLDEAGIQAEIEKTRALLESITGIKDYLMRPPYGSTDATVGKTVKVPMICWSVDSADWDNGSYDKVYNNVMSKVKDGSIVLMHANYQYTVDAVKAMIPELQEQGYVFVTVSELAAVRGFKLQSGQALWSGIK